MYDEVTEEFTDNTENENNITEMITEENNEAPDAKEETILDINEKENKPTERTPELIDNTDHENERLEDIETNLFKGNNITYIELIFNDIFQIQVKSQLMKLLIRILPCKL